MPPRLTSPALRSTSSAPTFRTRPQCLCEILISTRQFHQSRIHFADDADDSNTVSAPSKGRRRGTLLRRQMFEWLRGPGKNFLNPLDGSTNYLTAYDAKGALIRKQGRREAEVIDVIPEEQEEELQRQEEAEGLDEAERSERYEARQALRAKKSEQEEKGLDIPKERRSDLEPFPLNPNFRSESVLGEELREEIYRQVVVRGVDIVTVSAAFGVDTRRVAAVVRLMTIEKQWVEEGKMLAKPYNNAVLGMLPKTPFNSNRIVPHESINDLPVHPHTRQQLFVPTSESRHFTREDAAKAFSSTLLAADQRIPHPELITIEKEHIAGIGRDERRKRQIARDAEAQKVKEKAAARKKQWEAAHLRVVPGRRWDFKFEDVSAERTGRDGRGQSAVGIRYGMPHEDRKKGQIKIPLKVD